MAQRMQRVGGECQVRRGLSGGTRVEFRMPLQ
jgi:nitrate/nitrite-specific signal transduction histidine kinase